MSNWLQMGKIKSRWRKRVTEQKAQKLAGFKVLLITTILALTIWQRAVAQASF